MELEQIKSPDELNAAQGIVNPPTPEEGPGDPTPPVRKGIFAAFDKLKPSNKPTTDPGFAATEQIQSPVTQNANSYRLPEYRPYIDNPNPDNPNLDYERAKAQPILEQGVHTLVQAGSGILGGFLQAAGTNLDIDNTVNMFKGTQQAYGNALTEAGDNLIQAGQKAAPIYETQPGEFNPADPGWWFNKIGQSGTMIGMAGEAVVETAGITAMTEGTGLTEELGNLARRFSKISDLVNLGSNADRMKSSAVLFGLINRHNMGMMSANQTGQEEYNSLIAKGYSEADARQYASKAAAATYIGNIPLVALDILGFRVMTFNPMAGAAEGGLADSILDNTIGHIENPALRSSAILGIESAKGSAEMGWQYLASAKGREYADNLAIQNSQHKTGQALNDYFKGSELADQMATGFIGGLVTGGIFKGYDNLTQGAARRALDSEYKTFIDGMATTHLDLSDSIRQAEKDGNEDQANVLRRQLGINKALSAVHLDNLKGENAAFNSYKGYFQSLQDAVNTNDTDTLKGLGLEGHEKFLTDNIPQWLADADHIKNIYNDTKDYNKPEAVIPITYRKLLIDNLNGELDKVNTNILQTEQGMTDLTNLSSSGKATYDSKLQKMLFEARQGHAERALQEVQTSGNEEEIANLQGIIDHAKHAQEYHQDIIDQNADNKGNYADADITKSVENNYKLKQLHEQKADLESTLVGVRKQLNLWQDPSFQVRKKQSQYHETIKSADTVDSLDKVTQAMKDQHILTDELANNINDKRSQLVAKEEALTLKNKAKSPENPVNENISPIQQAIRKTKPKAPPSKEQSQTNSFGVPQGVTDEDNKLAVVNDKRKAIANTIIAEPKQEEDYRFEASSIETLTNTQAFESRKELVDYVTNKLNLNPQVNNLKEIKDANKKYIDSITPKENPNATIIDDPTDSWFDPAKINENELTDGMKDSIKSKMDSYISSLKADLKKEPSFSEVVNDFVNHTSKEDAERNFNLIKTGWELTGRKAADYDQVYTDIFSDRKSKGLDFFEAGKGVLATTSEELNEQNEELGEEQTKRDAPPVQTILTDTGQPNFIHLTPYQTVVPDLKLAHLSFPYIRTLTPTDEGILVDYKYQGNELNQSKYIDSEQLMNPNKYQEGTKLKIRIPDDADKVEISQWSDKWDKLPSKTFAEWSKDKDINSDEYIGRIPMIIYNEEGKGVAFVHDTHWYNPLNIGLVDTTEHQQETIDQARQNIIDLKKAVLANKELEVTINRKAPGTKFIIPRDKPLITIREANPEAKVGYINRFGQMVTSHGIYEQGQLINTADLSIGHKYDIRQAGLDKEGNPTYYASKVLYDNLDNDDRMSIIQALRVYASHLDQSEQLSKADEVKSIRDQVLKHAGLDLHTPEGVEKYLNMFVPTVKGKTQSVSDLYDLVASDSNIPNETPFIGFHKGTAVFGIKGFNIDGKNTVNYFSPFSLQGTDSAQAASRISALLSRIYKPDFLGKMKQNMDGAAILRDGNIAHISYDNASGQTSVKDSGKYGDYLTDKLKTNVKSFKLSDGTYTTFLQPTINYTWEKGQELSQIVKKPSVAETVNDTLEKLTGVPQDRSNELISKVAQALPDLEKLGLSQESLAALRDLTGNKGGAHYDPNYQNITDDIVRSAKQKLTKIDDLDTFDRANVVRFVANEIMNQINPQRKNVVDKKELSDTITKSFDKLIKPNVDLITEQEGILGSLYNTGNFPNLKSVLDDFGTYKTNADVLKKNWNYLINEAFEDYISKFTGIDVKLSKDQRNVDVTILDTPENEENKEHEDDQQDFKIDSSDEREKNYSRESVEDNGKSSVSYVVKRFLAQIPEYDRSGNEKKGFMGTTVYPGFDHYYNAIGKMLTAKGDTISDFEDMKIRLSQFSDAQPWVKEALNKLDQADEQLKNAFMYNFTRDSLSMKFVMHSFNRDNSSHSLKVFDTNANEILRVIQNKWAESFKHSPLSLNTGENYLINTSIASRLLKEFQSWGTKLPDAKQAQQWLSNFGIDVSNETMKELIQTGYYVNNEKGNPVILPYKRMFDKSTSSSGVFGRLGRYLELMTAPNVNLNYQENDTVNPFSDVSGILNKIASIESKYSSHITTNSFRDGSKAIYGFTPGKFATGIVNKLKFDPEVRENKGKISFSKPSYILDLLNKDPDFNNKFKVDHLGINAFKELGKPLYRDNNINSLSDPDHEITKLGMFQDIKQGEVKSSNPEGIPMRIGRMFFPTMSDKGTMIDLTTAVLKLNGTHIDLSAGKLSDNLNHFLFSQLIEPELNRIISHHKRAYNEGSDPNFLVNQKGYNLGAQIFHFILEANNLTYTTEAGENIRLIEYLAHSANTIDDQVRAEMIDKIKPQAYDLFNNLSKALVDQKMKVWEKDGFITKDDEGVIDGHKFLNNQYMKSFSGDDEEKLKMAAYDFTLNSLVTNANIHMLIAGDIANYSQDKAFKDGFEKDERGNPMPYKPMDDSIYSKISQDVIGVNLGKRLAMLIAPGSTLANSKGDKYIQLFAKDRITHTDNMDFLVHLYHGDAGVKSVKDVLTTLRESNDPKEVQLAQQKIAKKFPDLAAYTSFESTDAQEYATAKEGIDISFRQGRLDPAMYKDMNDKLTKQIALDKAGKPIPPELFLSGDQLDFIFQPQKPVVTGQMDDVDNDMSRITYVKSSNIFLIPQVTQAFPDMNEIRKGMEAVQEQTGKNVRLSYDTANKVGSPLSSNQLDLWDTKGNYNPSAIDPKRISDDLSNNIPGSGLIMDRENFRIQQDVPFKSDKIDHQDTAVLGTQMMKEIFGDGISQMTDKVFDFNGKKVSGQELHDTYNDLFNQWISHEKSNLYDQLGVDENTGQALDPIKTTQKIQGILQTEAKKRGYPKQDIDALELTNTYNKDNEVQYSGFTIPLWLSPNSNRYEALLNAIVTNRLLNLKLPGSAFVAGSEEGFRTPEQMPEGYQSRVIFTDKWKGSLQPAKFDEKGNLMSAQVLVPSKLRGADGKLLDLFKKDNGNYIYIDKQENGSIRLKEDMVDEVLKQMPSYRIPTSSHVSMSHVDIAGILPPEMGDLMVVPKNFTKQKGLDFDVDKENTYLPWHYIDKDNKVQPLDKGDINLENHGEESEDVAGAMDFLKGQLNKNQDIKNLIRQYEDEIEVNDHIGFNSGDAKGFIKQLKGEVDYGASKSELKNLVGYQKELKSLKSKLLQNEIIKVYNSILSSSHPEVQQKINRVLSTDFAEHQADLIDNLINTNKDRTYFTPLSDEYQKGKMGLGASGKMGIGVYSNYVVFHSLTQQVDNNEPIQVKRIELVNDEMTPIPIDLRIGKFNTDGTLGRMDTLDGGRSITELNAERQNTATDNEKLQIMGKTNTNDITINVDALLSVLGFDKDKATINGKDEEVSIPYFLLSQPIIRDYVDEMKVAKSTLAGYNPNAEVDTIVKLFKKYSNNGDLDLSDEDVVREQREALTGQKLADNISDRGADGLSQQAALHLFLEVKSHADDITKLQSRLNIQRDGLGKSVFDMLGKYDNVDKLAYMSRVGNIDKLIGDYKSAEDITDPETMRAEGYSLFNLGGNEEGLPFAVKPTTYTGSLIVHSAKAGHELWTKYFPYSNPVIQSAFDTIIRMSAGEDVQESKKLDMQYDISSEMKKYLYSSDKLGLFKGSPQDERERLFFDRKDKESLAGYLNKITGNGINYDTKDLITNNKLIGRFQYNLEKGKKPSFIKFDNTKGEDYNEEYKYLALVELLEKNAKLPDFQGQEYTTRKLGKDLINSAYLEGGVQEAIQYVKYIPIPLLKEIGFSDTTQLWQRAANGELFTNMNGDQVDIWRNMLGTPNIGVDTNEAPRFVTQYFQHNPEKLPKLSESNIEKGSKKFGSGGKRLEDLESFIPKGMDNNEPKPMISIYNPYLKAKIGKNFQIYKFDGKEYHRMPTLGTFGMSEYSIKDNNVKPLIDNNREPVESNLIDVLPQDRNIQSDFYGLANKDLHKTIQSIADDHLTGLSELASLMKPFIDTNTKLDIGDVNQGRSRGIYYPQLNEINIDQNFLNHPDTSKEQIAQTLLHEAAHSILSSRLSQYFDAKGNLKITEDKLPADVLRLHRVFKQVESKMGDELDQFKEWYQSNPGKLRSGDANERFLYAGSNIHEMAAMVLSEPDIIQRMNEIEFDKSGQTLMQKFTNTIKKILEAVGIKFNENSTAAESLDSILSILREKSEIPELPFEDKDKASSFGNIVASNESDLDNILKEPKISDKLDISNSTKKSPYFEKDRLKFSQANKLISIGSEASSSNSYKEAVGDKANSGRYTSKDIVGISAEGNRANRIKPNLDEIQKAIDAKVTFITDKVSDRNRTYNIGEREVAEFLYKNGYSEIADGTWKPKASPFGDISDISEDDLGFLSPKEKSTFDYKDCLF